MNKNYLLTSLVALLLGMLFSSTAVAQCPGCTISLPSGIPNDTIVLDTVVEAYKNAYYREAISFRLPYTSNPLVAVAPPGTNVPPNLNIDYFEIQSVTGLPPGMSWI